MKLKLVLITILGICAPIYSLDKRTEALFKSLESCAQQAEVLDKEAQELRNKLSNKSIRYTEQTDAEERFVHQLNLCTDLFLQIIQSHSEIEVILTNE